MAMLSTTVESPVSALIEEQKVVVAPTSASQPASDSETSAPSEEMLESKYPEVDADMEVDADVHPGPYTITGPAEPEGEVQEYNEHYQEVVKMLCGPRRKGSGLLFEYFGQSQNLVTDAHSNKCQLVGFTGVKITSKDLVVVLEG